MSEVMVPIRSVKAYFKEFGVNGIGKGADPKLVKQQLLDSFQKEIFGQLTMKFGDPALLARDVEHVDPETKRQVDNILSNSVRKWKRLCMVFAQYRETHNLIFPSDLMVTLEDIVKTQTGENEIVETGDLDGDEVYYDGYVEPEEDEKSVFAPVEVKPGAEFPAGYWLQQESRV